MYSELLAVRRKSMYVRNRCISSAAPVALAWQAALPVPVAFSSWFSSKATSWATEL